MSTNLYYPKSNNYNAIGFNSLDGLVYGTRTDASARANLVIINATGLAVDLGVITGLPVVSYLAGDMDTSGNLYVKTPGNTSTAYIINVVAKTATLLNLSQSFIAADIAFNPINNLFYGVNNTDGRLFSFDKTTGLVTFIGATSAITSFGAMYVDALGNIYGNQSDGQGFYQFSLTTGVRTLISASPGTSVNDGAICATSIITLPSDIAITKTDSSPTYVAGSNTVYTVTVSNNGLFGASNITVTDNVPAGIPAANVTYTAAVTGDANTNVVGTQTGNINDIVGVPVGGTVVYTVTVSVPSTYTGNLVNTANITLPSNISDSNLANNTATDTDLPCGLVPTIGPITQPTCATATGSFTITNYSATSTYTFSPLSPTVNGTGVVTASAGTYTVTATANGCTSALSSSITVNPQPATPATPTASVTDQPTCAFTGTVTTTAPANGAGITYTITGTAPVVAPVTNATGIFTGLAPGVYSVTTTNAAGCTSTGTSVTVNAQPVTPAAPVLSASTKSNICPATTADLTTLQPTPASGTTLEWHTVASNPTAGDLVASPSAVIAGTYYLYAVASSPANCFSLASSGAVVTITVCCTAPAAPVLSASTKSNICPATTADLTTLQPTPASGTTLEWHTVASNPTAGDLVASPSAAVSGTYYLYAVASSPANCFSPASSGAVVTITVCCTAPTAPVLSASTKSNICPATTADLTTLQPTPASGTTLEWHTVASNPTAGDLVASPSAVIAGTYYLYAVASSPANCFSPASSGAVVTITSCTPIVIMNTCPVATVNLMAHVDSTSKPVGTSVSWHSGTPATATNKVANPTTVSTSGTYYVCFENVAESCFGGTSTGVTVTITACTAACVAGTIAPAITPTTATNTCPSTTVSLGGLTNTGTKPAGTTLIWSTNKVPTSAGDTLTNLTTVSTAGKYYALYYDKVGACYSPADSVTVSFISCICPTLASGMPNDTTICSNAISIVVNGITNITTEDVKFVYFITHQTDANIIYGVTSTLLGTVANASLTNTKSTATYSATFPVNNTGSPILYHTYAILSPTSANAACRPFGHVHITVNPVVAAPILSANSKSNTCPSTTADITTLQPTPTLGTTLEWHTVASNPTVADLVASPSTVLAGTYYLYAKASSPANCFSTASSGAVVTITTCTPVCTPPTAPVLSVTTKSNTCPAITADLTSLQPVAASSTTLEWHTVASNPTAADLVASPSTVLAGTYYLYAKASSPANCFSTASSGAVVTITTCLPNTISNTCPQTTVNLMAYVDSTTKPSGAIVTWHSGTPATALNQIVNPKSVGTSGTYYTAYKDPIANCYGGTAGPLTVNIIICPATNVSNICPITTVNLMASVDSTTKPSGAIVTWHSGTPATLANRVANPSTLGISGTYYASYFDPIANCYGGAIGPLNVTINVCPAVCTPPTAPVLLATTKSNICPATTADLTALQPTPATGTTLEWHTVSSNPTAGDLVANPSTVVAGTYYLYAVASSPTNCFSTASSGAVVIITTCTTPTCPNPVVALASNQPTTCGGIDGKINLTGLTASTSFTINYQKDGGAVQSVVVLSDASGKATITGLMIGSYTNIQALLPCVSNKVATTVFGSASCVPPIVTPKDSTITVCTPLSIVAPAGSTAGTCTSYPKVLGATASVTTTGGQMCITYVPKPGFVGTDTVCVNVCDPITNVCTTIKVPVKVLPAPTAINDINLTLVNTPVNGSVATNDTKTASTDTFTKLTNPAKGTILFLANGTYTYTPNANFVGKDSVQYKICSVDNICSKAWLFLTVTKPSNTQNLPPVAQNDVAQTFKDKPVSGNLLSNDFDPEKGPLTATITPVIPPTNGNVVINPNGTYTYTPAIGFVGVDKFTYQVCDELNKCTTAEATIYITNDENGVAANDKPNAQDDGFFTYMNSPIAGNVKANDSDPNGNTLIYNVIPVSPVSYGALVLNTNGTFNYIPTPGFYGNDSFKYSVCDNGIPSRCDTATVVIVVAPPVPDAILDINVTAMNKPVSGNILTNDNGNGLPIILNTTPVIAPKHGTIVINPNGTYTYTPATGFVGKDSVRYYICNAAMMCDTAWLMIKITPPPTAGNDKPVANDDVAQTQKNVPVAGKVTNNDFDPDGNSLTVSVLNQPSNGTLVMNLNGTFTYTPDPNFTGTDKFKYRVCDPQGLCDTACVVIKVTPDFNGTANDKPNAQDDAAVTTQNTAVVSSLKPNDSDPNIGQTLTYNITPVVAPAHGTVTILANGNYTYTPTTGYTGPDRFTYRVCDNGLPSLCDTATVYLLVNPPAVKVLAINDINLTFKNTPVAGNVIINDNTNGLSPVTTTLITSAKNGVLTLNPNGTYNYIPNANFVGKDSIMYKLCNGIICDSAWVYLNVLPYPPSSVDNNKPVASNDVAITNINTPVSGAVGNNDFDPDLTQILAFTKLTNPTNGTVVFNPNGTYTYTPTPGFIGTDVFKYIVCDNGLPVRCDTASVTVKILPASGATNDKPVANDDAFVTTKGVGISKNAAPNDSDPNGNTSGGVPLTFSSVTTASNGLVNMNSDGTFTYAPNATFVGTDSFTYKICDNGTPSLCDTATVYITILPPAQPNVTKPDAVNDIANTPKGMPVIGNVLTNDDGKGFPITATVPLSGNPVHGTILMNPNGTYTYTPTPNYVGKDSVTYIVCNNQIPAKCDTAKIYFNVIDTPTPQNDKPIASNDVAQTTAGTPVIINVLNNDTDPDLGDVLTVSTVIPPANGTAVLNPNGTITYTPTAGFIGKDTFKYVVCDSGIPSKCDTAKVEIDVKPNITPTNANVAPTAQDDALITKIGTPKTGTVAPNDSDINVGQNLTFTAIPITAHGSVAMNPNGTYTYTPASGYIGTDSFKYKVCDSGTPSLCDSATVYITVLTNDKTTKPLAINDINITFIDTPVDGNVLTNDDGNGNLITSTLVTGINGTPKHGTIILQPKGSYFYNPNAGFVGKDSVQYRVCNNLIPVQCDTAWIYVAITPYPLLGINDKPIAMPDVAVTDKGKLVLGNVLNNDIDPEKGILTASVVTNPTNGTLVLNPNGTFTYTPNPTFIGTDVFKYKICDNGSPVQCDTASVTIKVLPIDPTVNPLGNKKPVANDDLVTTQGGKPVTASVAPNDTDPDLGQTLVYTKLSDPTNGTITMLPNGTYTYVPNAGFVGTDSYKYKVCDNGTPSLCDSATVIIQVAPSTTKPDATDDINITQTGKPTTGNVLTNDNTKGLPVTVSTATPPKHGTFVINPITGVYTYTPTAGYVGKDSVQYKICNNQIPVECDSAWIFITVAPTPLVGFNNAPIASHDVNSTDLNTPITGNVSGNDVELDAAQTLTFTSLGNPPSGTVVMNPNGSYTYTPAFNFVGNDTFKYKVCDSGTPTKCDTASVTITVNYPTLPVGTNKPPVANDDVVMGMAGKPVTINVGTNDKDPEGGTLTFTAIGGNPNVTISPTGVLTYTPQIDPITGLIIGGNTVVYKVCDSGTPTKCDTATVYLTVTSSTTKPLAINDINITPMNTSVTGNVLTNDDTKGLPVVVSVVTPPTKGIFNMNPDGTYSYLPNSNFVGKDSVKYQICNNLTPAECSMAWLFFNVQAPPTTGNNKPLANPDVAQTLMNVPVIGKVTNNDSDPDGQPLVASLLSNPTNGTLAWNPDGTFIYTPNANFVGTDKFKYKICDNGTPSLCDTASVMIYVLPKTTPIGANDRPFAQDDAFSTTKNMATNGSVSPNDFEPNVGQTLTFTAITTPASGSVVMQTNGTFVYTPTLNFVGTAQFKYKVCDSGMPILCDTATVYVTVLPTPVVTNTTPLAINDINITPINTLVTGNILTNDDKKGLPVTATILTPATNGIFTLGLNGAYTYLPTTGFVGKDSIRYEICNNKLPAECDRAWVFVTVKDNPNTTPTNPPVAMPDVNQTLVNKPVNGTVANNDSDPDLGQILSYTKLTNPTNGTVIFDGVTGKYTYTPSAGFVGTDVFTYKICDNGSPVQCASTNVTIKVTPDYSNGGNIKPIANDDAYTTNKGVGISGNASLNDYDPNVGQTLSYAAISIPANGLINMNPDGTFSYAPNATFVGTDKFLYKICDNGSPVLCDTATIYISVVQPQVSACVTFNLKAILEGPYSTVSGKMSNFLNFSGLLPGQTPTRFTGVATPNGQPYKTAPWNYLGTEVMPVGGYPATVVDWVLVSLRTDSLTTTPTFRAAGLLHDDGTITFVNPCFTVANGSYYILVEHRNHMGAMSHQKINITSGTITYDFTARESYVQTNPPSFGQKLRGTKYVMYTGDSRKATVNDNYDINASDSNFWKSQSGIFDKYLFGDYNFDADVNNADNTLWKVNNGRFSGVVH